VTQFEIRTRSSKLFAIVQNATLSLKERIAAYARLIDQPYGPWQSPYALKPETLKGACIRTAWAVMRDAEREFGLVFNFSNVEVADLVMADVFERASEIDDLREFIIKTTTQTIDDALGMQRPPAA
jgi:hypothetical protein